MPVVIHEFEAVSEPAPERGDAQAPGQPPADGGEPPAPQDLALLLRTLEARALRALAH